MLGQSFRHYSERVPSLKLLVGAQCVKLMPPIADATGDETGSTPQISTGNSVLISGGCTAH
jgi:hypothetical protein